MLTVVTNRPAVFLRRFVILLLSLTVLMAVQACKKIEQGNAPDAYVENGETWAYGQVGLTDLDVPGILMLDRGTADQTLNIAQADFRIFGLVKTDQGGTAERTIQYVDYHPQGSLALAYAYDLEYRRRAGIHNAVDVYVVLKKAGYTYRQRRLYIGTARFGDEARVEMSLHQSLKVSQIADGPGAGTWAIHYADVKNFVVRPWGSMCNGRVSQIPGQAPGQSPGQNPGQTGVNCRPLPKEVDLCAGDPTRSDCRPQHDFGDDAAVVGVGEDEETILREGTSRIFTMDLGVRRAKFVFISKEATVVDAKDNTTKCNANMFATTKTEGGKLNAACQIKLAPTDPIDDKLTCGLTVEFVKAETYLEKICNVGVHFRVGEEYEHQEIQVLKK